MKRILIVEDDEDVRVLVVRMAERLGYGVLQARDADEALALSAKNETADLLLTDVMLPGGRSGPDLARELCEEYPELRVVYMSGYPADALHRNAPPVSDVPLLKKPFLLNDLAEALSGAFARS